MSREGDLVSANYTLWFNPKCSKCRETLELLRARQIEPQIRRYLDNPPTASELKDLLAKLQVDAHLLLRTKEETYRTLKLSEHASSDEIISALVKHPELLERPILVHGDQAVIARPPERALSLVSK